MPRRRLALQRASNVYRSFALTNLNERYKGARKTMSKRGNRPLRSLGPLGFPKMIKMKHKYVTAPFQLNCIAGAMSTYVFSANSLYDPDFTTGVGSGQPMYYDQLNALYNHYVVIGAKIKLIVQTSEEVLGPMIGCLWIDDNSGTTATTLSHVAEYGANPLKNFGGPNSNPNTTFVKRWSAKKTFGPGVMANNALMGTDANPTEQSYFKFSYNTVDATSATIYVTAILEQIAIWKELKEVSRS